MYSNTRSHVLYNSTCTIEKLFYLSFTFDIKIGLIPSYFRTTFILPEVLSYLTYFRNTEVLHALPYFRTSVKYNALYSR